MDLCSEVIGRWLGVSLRFLALVWNSVGADTAFPDLLVAAARLRNTSKTSNGGMEATRTRHSLQSGRAQNPAP